MKVMHLKKHKIHTDTKWTWFSTCTTDEHWKISANSNHQSELLSPIYNKNMSLVNGLFFFQKIVWTSTREIHLFPFTTCIVYSF